MNELEFRKWARSTYDRESALQTRLAVIGPFTTIAMTKKCYGDLPFCCSIGAILNMKKISDIVDAVPCRDPSHNPPSHIVLAAGLHEHECPACKKKTLITIKTSSL